MHIWGITAYRDTRRPASDRVDRTNKRAEVQLDRDSTTILPHPPLSLYH